MEQYLNTLKDAVHSHARLILLCILLGFVGIIALITSKSETQETASDTPSFLEPLSHVDVASSTLDVPSEKKLEQRPQINTPGTASAQPSTTSAVPQPTPTTPISQKSLFSTTDMLSRHNIVRESVNVPPLTWSESLSKEAQKWSDVLKSEGCAMRHDPHTDHGENIYWSFMTGSNSDGLISKPETAVTWWAHEETFYNYEKNTCESGEQCGHYTQIVWKDTGEVGCGVSSCRDGNKQTDVWVCRYNPPGNFIGERPF